jgi:AraC family transcriptional regulator
MVFPYFLIHDRMQQFSFSQTPATQRILQLLPRLEHRLSEQLRLDDIAQLACYSRFHFERVFTEQIRQTPMDYLRRRRLQSACSRIRYETSSITQIALDCGFSSNAAFAKTFRQYFGYSARDWRAGAWRQYMHDLHEQEQLRNPEPAQACHQWFEAKQATRTPVAAKIRVRELSPFNYLYCYWQGSYHEGQSFDSAMAQLHQLAQQFGFATPTRISVWREDNGFLSQELLIDEHGILVPNNTILPAGTPFILGTIVGGLYACLPYQDHSPLLCWMHEDWLEQQPYFTFDATRPYLQRHNNASNSGELCLPIRRVLKP